VGAGNHILEKIIPALEEEKKSIIGIVTSKKKFLNIKNLKLLPKHYYLSQEIQPL